MSPVELLIGLVVFFIVVRLLGPKAADADSIIEKKECPPHQWYWEDIKDEEGNIHHSRMMCRRCGPLSRVLGLEK